MKIFEEIKKEIGYEFPLDTVFFKHEKGLRISYNNNQLTVYYSKLCELARAALLIKTYGANKEFIFEEKYKFDDICLMVDCSRNAVRNVETVKKLIRNLAMLGYNSLMLYTEDTYEVDGEPFFGYLRGKYTKAELKELDGYANEMGIELIPCIQTLGHLQTLKRYGTYYDIFDNGGVLMVGYEKVYALIEKMFKTLSECFTTHRIHIGMDEAWGLGRGNYLIKNGYEEADSIFVKHLNRVCEIAKKYSLQPIMWSDMFWRIAYEKKTCVDKRGNVQIPKEVLEKVPQEVALMHWDYYHTDSNGYDEKFRLHNAFENTVWFATTAWENRGLLPHNTYSTKVTDAAMKAVKKYRVTHIMNTMWGDNGNEGSLFGSLPAVSWFSLRALGRTKTQIKQEFFALTGYKYDEFNKIEWPQTFCGEHVDDHSCPVRVGLYNDLFCGWLDTEIREKDENYFKRATYSIRRLKKGQYDYLFETAAAISDLLSIKYGMGIRLRKAYQCGDKEKLKEIVTQMKVLEKKVQILIKSYRKQWYKENKTTGFEIQEIRLGGLLERVKSCRERLTAYLDEEIAEIPELKEDLIPNTYGSGGDSGRIDIHSYKQVIGFNNIDDYPWL